MSAIETVIVVLITPLGALFIAAVVSLDERRQMRAIDRRLAEEKRRAS